MSVASLVTGGFGTWGNIQQIVTAGYVNAGTISVRSFVRSKAISPVTLTQPGAPGLTLYINGVNRSGYLRADTTAISKQVNSRDTVQFSLQDKTGSGYMPNQNDLISFYRLNSTLLFRGFITQITTYIENGTGGKLLQGAVQAQDYSAILDRRVIGMEYDVAGFPTIADIVQHILSNTLADTGITLQQNTLTAMAVTDPYVFFWVPVTEALNTIAQALTCNWRIDEFGVLRFFTLLDGYTDCPAGPITEVTPTFQKLSLLRTLASKNNRVIAKSSSSFFAYWQESKIGIAAIQYSGIPTQWPIQEGPTISWPSHRVQASNGPVLGVDWYFKPGVPYVYRHPAAAPLADTDFVDIAYLTPYASAAEVKNQADIDQNGEYAEAIEVTAANTIDQLTAFATAELNRNIGVSLWDASNLPWDVGNFPWLNSGTAKQVTIQTQVEGYLPGQKLSIYAPSLGINENFVIDSVAIRTQGLALVVNSTVVASNQPYNNLATKVLGGLVQRTRVPATQISQTLVINIAPTTNGVPNPGIVGNIIFGATTVQQAGSFGWITVVFPNPLNELLVLTVMRNGQPYYDIVMVPGQSSTKEYLGLLFADRRLCKPNDVFTLWNTNSQCPSAIDGVLNIVLIG